MESKVCPDCGSKDIITVHPPDQGGMVCQTCGYHDPCISDETAEGFRQCFAETQRKRELKEP